MNRMAFVVAASLAVAVVLAGCGQDDSASKAATTPPPPPKVTVSKPEHRHVTDYDEYVGRFVAVDSVEVRAQVSGYLQSIDFTDGQLVEKGDRLFGIDPRPFQAALDQSKAAVEQAKANLAFAEADLKRGEGLARGTVITQQTFDQRIQARRVAAANVLAQEASQRQAELNLQFTSLTAPISGRIGDRRISVGNLVVGGTSGSSTLLASVTTVDPIRFEFTMDEGSYLRYVAAAGGPSAVLSANRGLRLPVRLKLLDETDFVHQGHIDFVDNGIDAASGAIRARAVFTNPDGRLTPGMFGRVQVAASPPVEALLVPDSAIASEQARKLVYVVGPDNVVSPRYVTLGSAVGDRRVVKSGVEADDTIVVAGLMRIRPGAKVTPDPARTVAGAD